MFHFVDAITNTKGDALIGYFVRVIDPDDGSTVTLYADESLTPIETTSGVADACQVDSDGNADFYVVSGEYHLDIYATDSTTLVKRKQNIPMASAEDVQANLDVVAAIVADGDKGDLTISGSGTVWTIDSNVISTFGRTLTDDADASTALTTLGVSTFVKTVLDDADAATFRATIGAGSGGGDLLAANNLSDVANAATARTNLSAASSTDLANAIALFGQNTPTLNGLVSGGQPIWVSGFTYKVTAATYYILGTLYSSAEQSITLSAADVTFDRIDVLALDTTGTLVKITGTAAAAPSEPDIDPATQLELTFVTVATGASAPATAVNESIYLEGSEWTTTVTGSHITANSTNNPRTGTKDLEATSAVTGDSVLFNKGSTLTPTNYSNVVFYLRNKTANWGTTRLRLHFQNASGARVGNIVTVNSGTFGLLTTNTSTYQAVSIPMTAFAIPASTLIQKLNIAVNGTGTAIGWYIDDLVLQLNGAGSGSGAGLTQTQADARYAQRSANLSDLASASTARTNLGLGTAAVKATGTSGNTVPLLDGTNTWSAAQTDSALKTLSAGGNMTPATAPATNAIGYLGAPQNIQNGTYTTVMSDSGKHIYHTSGSAHTWTIDSNANVAYPIGTVIAFVNENAGGIVTLAITSDTLRWGSSTGSRSLAANATATAIKVASTTWRLTGDGIT